MLPIVNEVACCHRKSICLFDNYKKSLLHYQTGPWRECWTLLLWTRFQAHYSTSRSTRDVSWQLTLLSPCLSKDLRILFVFWRYQSFGILLEYLEQECFNWGMLTLVIGFFAFEITCFQFAIRMFIKVHEGGIFLN